MPLPLILGAGAVALGIRRAVEIKDANNTLNAAEKHHEKNIAKFNLTAESVNKELESLNNLKLEIRQDLETFSNTIEKIYNFPKLQEYKKGNVILLKYNKENLKNILADQSTSLGVESGYVLNPIMAIPAVAYPLIPAIVGGAIGMIGEQLYQKADEAWIRVRLTEDKINVICNYLEELKKESIRYTIALNTVKDKYQENFLFISYIVNKLHKTEWNHFSEDEKIAAKNTSLLADLLYSMCQINLVNKEGLENGMNIINKKAINKAIQDSNQILKEIS